MNLSDVSIGQILHHPALGRVMCEPCDLQEDCDIIKVGTLNLKSIYVNVKDCEPDDGTINNTSLNRFDVPFDNILSAKFGEMLMFGSWTT